MPESDWEQILPAAAEEVLETMFFSGVFGPAPEGAPESPPPLAAQLRFEGSPSGQLCLSVSPASARNLAGNFLAADDPEALSAAELGAVLCELANMVCGSLLSRVESDCHFRLSSPSLFDAAEFPPSQYSQSYDLGDGVLRLALALEEHA
jgi:hypothetical protein